MDDLDDPLGGRSQALVFEDPPLKRKLPQEKSGEQEEDSSSAATGCLESKSKCPKLADPAPRGEVCQTPDFPLSLLQSRVRRNGGPGSHGQATSRDLISELHPGIRGVAERALWNSYKEQIMARATFPRPDGWSTRRWFSEIMIERDVLRFGSDDEHKGYLAEREDLLFKERVEREEKKKKKEKQGDGESRFFR